MATNPIDWAAFRDALTAPSSFLLVSHVRPDCDALGSELGLARVLKTLGKKVRIVNAHKIPANFAFIDPSKEIETLGEGVAAPDLATLEAVVILDTSAWVQLGDMADVIRGMKAKRFVLDHHVSEDDLGAVMFKNVQAEATGRLVVEAADALGVPLTEPIATPLFAALTTDTGWFRFNSVTATTLNVASRLVAAGAKPPEIYKELYEQETLARLRLRGLIMNRFEPDLDGAFIHTYVAYDDFARLGATTSDTEDAINLAFAAPNTKVAAIVIEQAPGQCKVSLRSRCEIDCSALLAQFKGGGHKAAAGASIQADLALAREKVIRAVREAMAGTNR